VRLSFLQRFWIGAILLGISGCASTEQQVRSPSFARPAGGVVFVADGAGGFEATSSSLRQCIQEAGLPLSVETLEWSHGYGRIIADQIGHDHVREAAHKLSSKVATVRATSPDTAVYLIGHSAGTAIVLGTAELLPPESIDRIILLAPSVSADYDLRPALRCVRQKIDVFTSSNDWWYLGLGVRVTGTTDGHWTSAAGRIGFRPRIETPEDAMLYKKLEQHSWAPDVEWTGNHGGHYGCHNPEFMKAYVLPLFSCQARSPTS
jgi:pimeloyl-ACP methyl ester carboxylesterase